MKWTGRAIGTWLDDHWADVGLFVASAVMGLAALCLNDSVARCFADDAHSQAKLQRNAAVLVVLAVLGNIFCSFRNVAGITSRVT